MVTLCCVEKGCMIFSLEVIIRYFVNIYCTSKVHQRITCILCCLKPCKIHKCWNMIKSSICAYSHWKINILHNRYNRCVNDIIWISSYPRFIHVPLILKRPYLLNQQWCYEVVFLHRICGDNANFTIIVLKISDRHAPWAQMNRTQMRNTVSIVAWRPQTHWQLNCYSCITMCEKLIRFHVLDKFQTHVGQVLKSFTTPLWF